MPSHCIACIKALSVVDVGGEINQDLTYARLCYFSVHISVLLLFRYACTSWFVAWSGNVHSRRGKINDRSLRSILLSRTGQVGDCDASWEGEHLLCLVFGRFIALEAQHLDKMTPPSSN